MFRETAFRTTLIVMLLGMLFLTDAGLVQASPPIDEPVGGAPESSGVVGASSTAIDCLAAADSSESEAGACPSAGSVELNWRGEAESARLVLSLPEPDALPQGPITLRVNGQAVSVTPGCAPEHPCLPGAYFYLKVPTEAVVHGTNQIELLAGEGAEGQTRVAHVRLQVRGDVTPVLPDASEAAAETAEGEIGASAVPYPVTFVNFKFPDDPVQDALVQRPDSYNPNVPTPLLVYAHARSRTMEDGPDTFGAAANTHGWLLISPQMHGSWEIPPECYDNPDDCEFINRVLIDNPGYYAHASLESQYDLVSAVQYMVDHFNVDPERIYLVGGSMGAQTTYVTAAKFPHLFAAAYAWMGISNLERWYGELESSFDQRTLENECHIDGTPQIPDDNRFCYEQRSGVRFGRNFFHIPISMTHQVRDAYVPISHSYNMVSAINAFGPDYPASVYAEPRWKAACDDPWHCVDLDPYSVLDYLDDYSLNNNPDAIRIASDESKLYYWMNLTQTGAPHWSDVDVTRDPDSPTVQVAISDTHTLHVGLNLGTSGQMGEVFPLPGMGLPYTTYLRYGAGYNDLVHYSLVNYPSGSLTTSVTASGWQTFTLSALEVNVTADPAEVPGDQTYVSTITIQVRDSSDQARPAPNGTPVQLHTSAGTFANGYQNITRTTVNGQATTTLTITPEDDQALITATVGLATGSATVNVIPAEIGLDMTPASQTVYAHIPFTVNYRVTNESTSTLNGVAVTTDNGGSGSYPVCTVPSLAPGASTTCSRQITLSSSATVHGQATGQTSAGGSVSASDSVQITILNSSGRAYLPYIVNGY